MTDIGNWRDLIRVEGAYILVPLNAYQMGNLLDALTQAKDTGDWWRELQDIVAAAMDKAEIKEVQSNTGLTFTQGRIHHDIMSAIKR
jgi:hypothetical protein